MGERWEKDGSHSHRSQVRLDVLIQTLDPAVAVEADRVFSRVIFQLDAVCIINAVTRRAINDVHDRGVIAQAQSAFDAAGTGSRSCSCSRSCSRSRSCSCSCSSPDPPPR